MTTIFERIVAAVGIPDGQCYYASEALYHALGGKRAGWVPQLIRAPADSTYATHWYLQHRDGTILDPTAAQFTTIPDYRPLIVVMADPETRDPYKD